MKIRKFYDENKKSWAIQLGEEIEHFNHETPEHNKKNADASGIYQTVQ